MNGLEAIADQGYKTAKGVVQDLISQKPLNEMLNDRTEEAIMGLAKKAVNKAKRKMTGQSGKGINKRRTRRTALIGGRKRRKTKQIGGRKTKTRRRRRTTKKKRVLDIFQ